MLKRLREADPETPDPAQAFDAEVKRQEQRLPAIVADTEAEIVRMLGRATDELRRIIAGQPSDYQTWSLPNLQRSINRVAADLGIDLAAVVSDSAAAAWAAGIEQVDAPLQAAGVSIAGRLQAIDTRQLMAMRTFLTGRMKDVALESVNKVNTELGLVIIGAQTPADAAGKVEALVGGGRQRAVTIVRTEVGTAYAHAAQERQAQAAEALRQPNGKTPLKKQWRRSGKLHSRPSHDLADGQIAEVDTPFKVGGEDILYPRDPKAPAKHRINCGCTSLPYMDSWEVLHPGDVPISDAERADPWKHKLAAVRDDAIGNWADGLLSGRIKPTSHWETVAAVPDAVLAWLKAEKKRVPKTLDIGITDKKLLHLREPRKVKNKTAISEAMVKRLPDFFNTPKAVLWDKHAKNLVFVLDVPGRPDQRAKVVVRLGDVEQRSRRQIHNWVVNGGLVPLTDLEKPGTWEPVTGTV